MVEIERQVRKSKSIPLVSLIDVVFQLLIYFMLTTSFTRAESLELALPSSEQTAQGAEKAIEDAEIVHIYISDTGETFLERKSLGEQEIAQELRALLAVNPQRGILVLSSSQVPVGLMVHVLDRIYTAGGKNVAVADWVMPKAEVKPELQEKKSNG